MDDSQLIKLAFEARKNSYSPYSHFAVGAAILAESSKVYAGCNMENVAYANAICAERNALCQAIAAGERRISKIAIVGGQYKDKIEDDQCEGACAPCGMCRQSLIEFCKADELEIILGTANGETKTYTLADLFPLAFGPEYLA